MAEQRTRLEETIRAFLEARIPQLAAELADRILAPQQALSSEPPEPIVAAPPAAALFDAARTGGAVAVRSLLDLPINVLKALIGDLGFDPSRRVRKWKSREKVIDFVAEESVKRVRRNRAFQGGADFDPPEK